jgi:hypothetical protein
MTESHRTRKFADELVSQDAAVSGFNFEEFRMNLEEKLKSIEHRAGCVRRASLIASAATVIFLPPAVLAQPAWLQAVSAICFFTALITAGVLLSLYWHIYRQAVDRARSDLQLSMIADLQCQIAKLIQRLDDRDE